MRFSTGGLEAYNIYNVLCAHPATSADLASIAGVFQAWWNTQLRGSTASTTSWLSADLTALDSPGSPFLAYNNSGILTGNNGASTLPPQVTLAISMRTGLSGRSFRGRVYMVGLSNLDTGAGGLISTAKAAGLSAVWNNLRTSLVTAGFQLCVLSLYSGKDPSGHKKPRIVGLPTPVTAIVCGLRVDTQRRRLPVEGRA